MDIDYICWIILKWEMRVFACYCNDPNLFAMLDDPNFDFHDYVTKTVWQVEKDGSDLWEYYRRLAKAINFGLIFGMGNRKLAQDIQQPLSKAVEYKREYFDRFPASEDFIDAVKNKVKRRGYIFNKFSEDIIWITIMHIKALII